MAKHDKVIFKGDYLEGYWHPRGMVIEPTKEGLEEFEDYGEDYWSDLGNALEDWMGNGWMWIAPEDIGALTDAPIMSMDATLRDDGSLEFFPGGAVYAHMNYMVEDPIQTWKEGRGVVWDASWAYPVYDAKVVDGDVVYVMADATFTGDIAADIKRLRTNAEADAWLHQALGSGDGITDKKGDIVYWGADVHDVLRAANPGTSDRKLKSKLLR